MGHINAVTVVNRFKRTFGEETLNELGKLSRFCRRERTVTPLFAHSTTYRRTPGVLIRPGIDYRDVSSSDWSMFMGPLKN